MDRSRASAAVFDGTALRVVDDLEVAAPAEGEVTVRVLASGICHSDLNVLDGTSPYPPPVVLGHEGAGVVERVGPGVDGLGRGRRGRPPDRHAVRHVPGLSPGPPDRLRRGVRAPGPPAHARTARAWRAYANVGSFSERTTVSARQLVAVDGLAAPLGVPPRLRRLHRCGHGPQRGLACAPGDRVAVIGIGGIGANAIQAARLAGATVTAVDRAPDRRAVAERFGATAFVSADEVDGLHGSFDVVIECSGAPAAIDAAIALTAPGGTTALVGLPPRGHRASFDVTALMSGRTIVGAFNGDTLPERDLPLIVDDVRAGRLDLDGLVSAVWPLEEIADAIAAVRAGEVLRAVLDLGDDRRPGRQVVGR